MVSCKTDRLPLSIAVVAIVKSLKLAPLITCTCSRKKGHMTLNIRRFFSLDVQRAIGEFSPLLLYLPPHEFLGGRSPVIASRAFFPTLLGV